MLFDITNYIKKEIDGIIQVGAHYGSEYQTLKKISQNILMFEPQKGVYEKLCENLKSETNVIIENLALGSESGICSMYIEHANNGQSSSLLMPAIHSLQYPQIKFTDVQRVEVTTLNEYFKTHKFNYSLMTLDVQGYELKVLKGSTDILDKINYILCEVNRAELYKGCPMVEEIDLFLKDYGFVREHTSWDGYTWGDAFYVKS